MNKKPLLIITAVCTVLILISWIVVITAKTKPEKQLDLINQANRLMSDGIYITAAPLLEKAAGIESTYTRVAEEELKKVYTALAHNRGYMRRYTTLLEKQMSRNDAPPEIFAEAAEYYMSINATQNALEILKAGIVRTENQQLMDLYESVRYEYKISRNTYEAMTAFYNGTIQVMQDGKWGIIKSDGSLLIPCRYDKISTYYKDRAIVLDNGIIYAADSGNNRIALAPATVTDFTNLSENRTALLTEKGWLRATGSFEQGSNIFESISVYSGGYAAAKTNGKWGVIDIGTNWLIPPGYDEVITDELGRCYAQGAVFVRTGSTVHLLTNGNYVDSFENAHPFDAEGYAAVRRGDKWGYTDTAGNIAIDFIFDDARSFGGHLAAVKINDMWGYINTNGTVVIEAVFMEAGRFENGSAPVRTQRGMQIITLTEYANKEKII